MAIGFFKLILGCFSNGYENTSKCLDLTKKPSNLGFLAKIPILAVFEPFHNKYIIYSIGSNRNNLGLLGLIPIFRQLQTKRSDLDVVY